MKNVCVVVFLCFGLLFIGCVDSLTCGDAVCGNDSDACCDDIITGTVRCYNTDNYVCASGDAGTGVCATGQDLCDATCYYPSLYRCCADVLYSVDDANAPGPDCSVATPTPTPATSAPTGCNCGDLPCCGSACYDPTAYTCTNSVLCGNVAPGQPTYPCGPSCIDPTEYKCCGGNVYQLAESSPCDATSAPSTPAPTTPAPTTSAPTTLAPTPAPFCCAYSSQCGGPIPCPAGLSCCTQRPTWGENIGGNCYDPNTEVCSYCSFVTNPNHPVYFVCPKTNAICC